MSTAIPITRSSSRVTRDAAAGQTVFTFDAGPVWDVADLVVQSKRAPETRFTTLTTGFTPALLSGGAAGASVTFPVAPRLVAGDPATQIRIVSRRTHERSTDISRAGRLHTPSMETEHDKLTTTLQELRRDVDEAVTADLIGAPNGVAPLDSAGLLPLDFVPIQRYRGTWNAATNSPAITSGTGTTGDYYVVATAGNTTIDGVSLWQVGDEIRYNGAFWQKVPAYKPLTSYGTRIAAAAASIPSVVTSLTVGGYTTEGDGGGATYRRLASAPSPVELWHFQSADGAWWEYAPDGPVNIRALGARNSLVINSGPAILAAWRFAAGRLVYAPVGQYRVDATLNYSGIVRMIGDGHGAGPGAVTNTNCTQILANFSLGDVFQVQSIYGHYFPGIQFNSNVGLRSSGAAIRIAGPSPNNNANSKIDACAFNSQYVCIQQSDCSEHFITRNYFQAWARSALINESTIGNEVGPGSICNNYFFGSTAAGNTQTACIEFFSGYARIYDNLILGAQIGVRWTISQIASGNPHVHHNTIEEQTVAGVYFENANGKTASMIMVDNNEFSNVTNVGATYQAHVSIVAGAANWVDLVSISNNVMRSGFTSTSTYYINCAAGTAISISDNKIYNIGGSANPTAIRVGSQTTAPIMVSRNVLKSFAANRMYDVTAATVVHDFNGMPFANIGVWGNGSQVYVTDGRATNAAGFNFIVTSGGSGCQALRMQGAWVSFV